jgi:hypothetical protein
VPISAHSHQLNLGQALDIGFDHIGMFYDNAEEQSDEIQTLHKRTGTNKRRAMVSELLDWPSVSPFLALAPLILRQRKEIWLTTKWSGSDGKEIRQSINESLDKVSTISEVRVCSDIEDSSASIIWIFTSFIRHVFAKATSWGIGSSSCSSRKRA